MAKVPYGRRYWLDRFPASRRPTYPRHRGRLETEVAIVGGGALGCVTACVFAAAGVKVALFEAARLAQADTVGGRGIVLHEPEADLQRLVAMHGLRIGREIYRASRRGSLEFLAAIRRFRIDCGIQVGSALHVTPDPVGSPRLRREYAARREAGLEIGAVAGMQLFRQTGLNGFGIRSHGHAVIDPYRAALGFARAAAARGAAIFERSPVQRIRPAQRLVEIKTNGGTASASVVVVATGYPSEQFGPLQRRFIACHSYSVLTPSMPADIRRQVPAADVILRDDAAPDHWLRWMADNRLLFSGGDQPKVPERGRPRALVQRTGQLMYELSVLYPAISGIQPDYGWDVGYARTADGVPYFGPHRNYPHHLFAFGAGPAGLGLSYLAARILLRHYLGRPEKGDELFYFTRIRE